MCGKIKGEWAVLNRAVLIKVEDGIMCYVLTNGKYYIKITKTGAVAKTDKEEEARMFLTTEKAKERLKKAPGKTKGYYILDVGNRSKYYLSNGRIRFPREVRKSIYHAAEGRCALCGREIGYRTMTLDHIKPLGAGGTDSIENTQCTCGSCNLFKGSVLPDDFMERITSIFLYQMERRYEKEVRWKIAKQILDGMI